MPFRVPRWFVLHAFAWAFVVAQVLRSSAPASPDPTDAEPVTHWPVPSFQSSPAPPREPDHKPIAAIRDAGPGTHPSATLTFRLGLSARVGHDET